jgi:hypothetical protein
VEGARARGWKWTQTSYRQTLFGKGSSPKEGRARIDAVALERVIKSGGELPLHEVLRCRVRYFSDGAVLGGKTFVQNHLSKYQKTTGRRKNTTPRPLPSVTSWGGLNTLRGLRRNALGA